MEALSIARALVNQVSALESSDLWQGTRNLVHGSENPLTDRVVVAVTVSGQFVLRVGLLRSWHQRQSEAV